MSWNPNPPSDAKARRAARIAAGTDLARDWNRALREAARRRAAAVTVATRSAVATIPVDARRELRGSLWRLRKVRSPHTAAQALEDELGVLLRVTAPILVANPLPVHRAGSGRAVVAGAAGAAAATEQLELLIAAFSAGTTVPATLPIALSAMVAAMAVELYVALSVRVHALEAAGAHVDPQTVAAEVGWAMAGAGKRPGRAIITRQLVRRLTVRVLARWGRGIVPIAGAAYSGWDAQRTVAAIASLPVQQTIQVANTGGKSIKELPTGAE